jgi:hypothetical protein
MLRGSLVGANDIGLKIEADTDNNEPSARQQNRTRNLSIFISHKIRHIISVTSCLLSVSRSVNLNFRVLGVRIYPQN